MPEESVIVARSYCRICTSQCGILVDVAAGEVVRVRGDRDHPLSQGYTCAKGRAPTPAAVTQIVAAVGEHRDDTGPFDVVITGRTQPAEPDAARETAGSIAAAGATWWLEGFRPGPGEYAAALRRVDAGPPQ